MSIFNLTVGMADLSKVTGENVQTLKSWLHRDLPVASNGNISGGGGPGQRRRFSFFTVMEFALASHIRDLTFGTRDIAGCFNAAAKFAHEGSGKTFALPERLPGLPFHYDEGRTVLGVTSQRTFEELWKPGQNYDTFGKLRHWLGSPHFIAIDASEVFETVCARLDMDPNSVLDEVYKAQEVV